MIGDMQVTLGERLHQHRTELGLSKKAFAEQLGFNRNYLRDVEEGKRNPTLQSLEKMAVGLGIDPYDLIR